MRSIIIFSCFLAFGLSASAQTTADINKSITDNQFETAKQQIDRFLSDPANKDNYTAWYYKGKVYAELFKKDLGNQLSYDMGQQAFAAYKKYQILNPANVLMILDENVSYFGLYDSYYNAGILFYNKKGYDDAFKNFKAALQVEDYTSAKGYSYRGYTFPKLDTQLVKLTASAAYLAGKRAEAIPYYAKLADANLTGDDYKEVYAELGAFYSEKGDAVLSQKYLNLGRKFFPRDEDYWIAMEFGEVSKDPQQLMKRYEEMTKKYPDNYSLSMDYATQLFNYTYSYTTKPADYEARRQKLEAVLKKTISLQSTPLANYIMMKHVSNTIYDLDEERWAIKGTSADDMIKKNALLVETNMAFEDLNKYAQASYDLYTAKSSLTDQEKTFVKQVLENLVDYYQRKNNTSKLALYKSKLDAMK